METIPGDMQVPDLSSIEPESTGSSELLVQELVDKYTTKKPIAIEGEPDAHTVRLTVGVQSFQINDYCENQEHADWLRTMLGKAIHSILAEQPNTGK